MKIVSLVLFAYLFWASSAFAVNPGISYEGHLSHFDNTPVVASSVTFKIQLQDPTGACVLLEEVRNVDMSLSNGDFAFSIGDGTVVPTGGSSTLAQIFAGSAPLTCISGGTYTPGYDVKKLSLSFQEFSGPVQTFALQDIHLSPASLHAMQADKVGDFDPSTLLRVANGTVPAPAAAFTSAEFSTLQNIISGSSPLYQRTNSVVGTQVPSYSGQPSAPANGSLWYDTGSNTLKAYINGIPTPLGSGGGGITALTGDVTATGPGSAAATVAMVGGVPAANVATGANLANAATNVNTVSTIVKRDPSGNFAAGAITSTSHLLKDTGVNTVNLSAPTTITSSYVLKFPNAVAASTGQVLASDTAGNMSWSTLPTALPPNGSASGDLGGTYPNPMVTSVGGSSASAVNLATTSANAATNLNTAGMIVKRDGSGNFVSNVATLNGLALNNAGSILNIVNPVAGAWTMTLPATAGAFGQIMQTNGSGLMTWTTPSTTYFQNGANSFGANAILGTNDAYRLDMKTSNTVRMTVDVSGKVGIGTTFPSSALDVSSGTSGLMVGADNGSNTRTANTTKSASVTMPSYANTTPVMLLSGQSGSVANDMIIGSSGGPGMFGATAQHFFISSSTSDNTGGIEKMTINSAGNVGINNTAPTATLDVNGMVKLGTSGTAFSAMGTCTSGPTSLSASQSGIPCTGVQAGSAVSCSPSSDPLVSWGTFSTANGQITFRFSGAPSGVTSWKCQWAL